MSTVWLGIKYRGTYVLALCALSIHAGSSFSLASTWILLVPLHFFFPLSAAEDAHPIEQLLFLQVVWSLILKEWHLGTKMWVLALLGGPGFHCF